MQDQRLAVSLFIGRKKLQESDLQKFEWESKESSALDVRHWNRALRHLDGVGPRPTVSRL